MTRRVDYMLCIFCCYLKNELLRGLGSLWYVLGGKSNQNCYD